MAEYSFRDSEELGRRELVPLVRKGGLLWRILLVWVTVIPCSNEKEGSAVILGPA
jgi:hypothetical protein